MTDQIRTTLCTCTGGSTHATADPAVRRCDLCGAEVPTNPATGEYVQPPPSPRTTTIEARMAERRFINELGHRIMLAVHQLPHTGDVQITIAGPDSDAENLLTHDEAVMLRDALQEVLP